MGLFGYLFSTAGEVRMLTRQCQFYENQVEHLEKKIVMLEKTIISERKRTDKFQVTYFDQISTAFKLRPAFKAIEEPNESKQELPPTLNPTEEAELDRIAKAMHKEEIDNGGNRGLHEYIQAVHENPSAYLEN